MPLQGMQKHLHTGFAILLFFNSFFLLLIYVFPFYAKFENPKISSPSSINTKLPLTKLIKREHKKMGDVASKLSSFTISTNATQRSAVSTSSLKWGM